LEKAQARIAKLVPEQAERLERYRDYLEQRLHRPVSPAEAFVDVVGVKVEQCRVRS